MEGLTEELLKRAPELVVQFAAMGPAAWIAGGVFALLMAGLGVFFYFKNKNALITKSNLETEKNRSDAQKSIDDKNRSAERAAREAEKKQWEQVLKFRKARSKKK